MAQFQVGENVRFLGLKPELAPRGWIDGFHLRTGAPYVVGEVVRWHDHDTYRIGGSFYLDYQLLSLDAKYVLYRPDASRISSLDSRTIPEIETMMRAPLLDNIVREVIPLRSVGQIVRGNFVPYEAA